MKKIIHTGDWHIGRFQGPDGRFEEIKTTLCSMGKKIVAEKPDLIIVAGDIFHQAKTWSDRAMGEIDLAYRMIRSLSRVAPVVIVRGTPSHDGEEQYKLLQTLFKGNKRVYIATTPEIFLVDGIAVAAVPGFDKGIFRSQNDTPLSKEEENVVFTQAVADTIIGLSAQIKETYPDSISVLASHFTVAGANMESGQTAMMSKAEPVVAQETLLTADYTVNCFGHIHRPQQIVNNTFYCGAPYRLNFNDEGQERGFYVHEVDESDLQDSKFIALDSREFLSLSLTSKEVAKAMNGEFPKKWDAVSDKIVRVSYECTEEQKDGVNAAVMQKYLYNNGAYAVCDIIRKDIEGEKTKSVIKNKAPIENFKEFFRLQNAEGSDLKEAEVLEKAETIINKVLANQGEAPTGQLLLKRIQWENYRSFKGAGELDFSSYSFATLNGKNGVGKSSIFEMVLDCLYEKPREGSLTGWISNDPDVKKGSLQLVFSIGDREFKVTRTRLKSGKATLNVAERDEETDDWVNKSKEKAVDTQKEIEAIIGLDAETLKATCLILQDQYGTFLETDKETRMVVLSKLFNLSVYEEMKAEADEKLSDSNRAIRMLKAKESVLAEEIQEEAQKKEKKKEKEKIEKDLQQKLTDNQKEYDKTTKLLAEAEQRDELTKRLDALKKESVKKEEKIFNAERFLANEKKILANALLFHSIEKQMEEGKAYQNQRNEYSENLSKLEKKRDELIKRAQETDEKIKKFDTLLSKKELLQEKEKKLEKAKKLLEAKEKKERQFQQLKESIAKLEVEILTESHTYEKLYEQKSHYLRQAELIENSNCPLGEEASCNFLKEAVFAKKNLPEIEGKIVDVKKTIDGIYKNKKSKEAMLEEMGDIPREVKELKTQIADFEKKLSDNRQKLDVAENQKKLLESEKASLNDRLRDLNIEIASIQKKLKELVGSLDEQEKLVKKADALKKWGDDEKLIPIAKERKEANEERLKEIKEEIMSLEARLAKLNADANVEALNAKIKDLESEKEESSAILRVVLMDIGGLEKSLEDIKTKKGQLKEVRKELKSTAKASAQFEFIKLAFSNDGIPKLILKDLLPDIEETATRLFSQMQTTTAQSINFITEKKLKNKKEVDTLDIVIADENQGTSLPYLSKSGGEKVKAALSVILALADVRNRQTGIQPGFLFIDEPPFLDDNGVTAYCDALESVRNKYPDMTIMAITHDMAMRSRFPECISVEKTEDGSKICF